MGDKQINHGIVKNMGRYSTDKLNDIRDKIKVGDKLRYPKLVKDSRGELVERWVICRVTGKYPNLVTVRFPGPKYPIRTISYLDIMTDSRFTQNL